jgi:hypothetical protein
VGLSLIALSLRRPVFIHVAQNLRSTYLEKFIEREKRGRDERGGKSEPVCYNVGDLVTDMK